MKTKLKVKNQWQQALWYVGTWRDGFSLVDVINHSMFFKFQTRLSEIEAEHGVITTKESKSFTNTFGRKSSYFIYKCSDIEKTRELFKKY